jgi:hypothetical protein
VWFEFSDSSQKSGDGEINAPGCKGKRSFIDPKAFPKIIRDDARHIWMYWETIGMLLGNDGVDLSPTAVGVRLSNI